ncbi:MAG: ABC transporter substrate-binding protein [Methylotenera sp.]|nr:ABC transporter substrate-binding protein [Methylotenera sp.]MDO9388105.1 ABC transporter substrate-binding protein [Methylotenera sp.]
MKILYFIIGLSVLLLCGCNQTNANAPTPFSAPIQFAVTQAPLNLDPRYASDAASERVNRLIYQPLVDFDAQSKPAPRLASWVEVNPHQYRFTLNKARAPFHHGKPLTARDVKATYDSLAQLKNSPHTAEFSNIKSIEVENENTVIFALKQADKHFPAKLIIGILPQDLIEKNHDFSHHPIGSGALQFVSWQNKLVLKRMTDGQMITLIEVKDPTVRVLKLLRGEVDLLQGDLPPELIKHLQTKPEITVSTSQGANFSYLGLNLQDSLLKNLKVRQAVAYAMDRQAIIAKVMVKNTRLAGAILPPEHYAGNANLTPYEYNPVKARQLLIEAGVKLPLKLVYKTSTDAQRVRFATILQAQMQPAGINLEIHSLDWGTFFEDVKQGEFQLFGLTWVGIKTPEIYTKAFSSQSFPPNGFNRGRFADAKLDSLLGKEDWAFTTSRIHEQLPYIPLWYEGQFAALNKNIKNYAPKPDGNWDDLATITRPVTIQTNKY